MKAENKSKLSDIEIVNRLAKLKGWELNGKYIEKRFVFESFGEINRFLPYLTKTIVMCNHHPDFNFDGSTKSVFVKTTTHSEQGLTQADFDLAEALQAWKKKA